MDDNQFIVDKAIELLGSAPEQFEDVSPGDNISQRAMLKLLACEFIEGNFIMAMEMPSCKTSHIINFNLSGERASRTLAQEIVKREKDILSSYSPNDLKLLRVSVSNILRWKLTEYGSKYRKQVCRYFKIADCDPDEFPNGEWKEQMEDAEFHVLLIQSIIAAEIFNIDNKAYQIRMKKGEELQLLEEGLRAPTDGKFKIIEITHKGHETKRPNYKRDPSSVNLKAIEDMIVQRVKRIRLGEINLLGLKSRKLGRPEGKTGARLTQKDVAELLNISPRTIRRIEKDRLPQSNKANSVGIAEWYSKALRNKPIECLQKAIKNSEYRIPDKGEKVIFKILKTRDKEVVMEILQLERDYTIIN